MTDFTIQNFYYNQEVNQDNLNGAFTSTGQQIAAFFPKLPNISSGIGNMSNRYGQVGTTNQFNFVNGVFQFPKQVGPIGGTQEYTYATYTSTGLAAIAVPTDGTTYYIVAQLSTTIIDPGQYSTSVTILTTAMTLAQINVDTNIYLPICTIVSNAGVYTVSVDNQCAYNYGFALSGNSATGDIKYSYQTQNHLTAFGSWLICNGSTFDSATYPNLYALLGSTTLPNITDRTIAMASSTHPVGTTAGANSQTVVLPQHTHGVTDPGHSHTVKYHTTGGSDSSNVPGASGPGTLTNYTTSPANTGISIQNAGTAGATMSVLQPTLYVRNAFIFAN